MQIRMEIVKEIFNESYRKIGQTGDQAQSSVRQTERPRFTCSCRLYPLVYLSLFWFLLLFLPPAHPHGSAECCSSCTLPVWGCGFTVLSITKSRLIAHQFMWLGGVFLVIVTQFRSPPPDNPAGMNISWKFLEFEAS